MKKIKSIWMFILVMALSVAMMIGSFNLVAVAETIPFTNGSQLVAGSVVSKVKLGDTFEVPAGNVTVTAPNGSLVKIDNGAVTAEQLGNYVVSYKATVAEPAKDLDYTYTVNCFEETEYYLFVAGNGSAVPTYAQTNAEFKVPEFYLAYKDEDGKIIKAENQSSSVIVSSGVYTAATKMVKASRAGTMYVTLNACIGEMNAATKVYSREFKVNVQNKFEDTTGPVLTVVNVPTTGSVNAKISLPKATATDDFDDNMAIIVKVTDPDGNPVKDVVLNDYGYAESQKEKEVAFDNIDVTDFYPVKTGTYKITYQAIDDSGNKSGEHSYYPEVSDKLAPVIYDINENEIPTVWGLTVENAKGFVSDPTVHFPMPVLVDNSTAEDDLTLTFTLQDAGSNNTTVLKFSDKVSKYKEGIAIGDDYKKYFQDNVDAKFTQEGLSLDFNKFKFGASSEYLTEDDMFGDWIVTYTVKDEANNSNSSTAKKSYTLTMNNAFEDVDAPNIDEIVVPTYLMVGTDDEVVFDVPQLVAADSKDTRLTLNYNVVGSDGFAVGEKVDGYTVVKSIDVDGGETMKIIGKGDNYYLAVTINNADLAILVKDSFKLEYNAADDAGNKTEMFEETVDVLYAGNVSSQQLDVTMNITPEGKAGTSVNLGGFSVSGVEQREYTGFELTVKDYNGNILSGVDLYTHYNKAGDTMYVKNITFEPAKGGVYELYIRVFDITGKSSVYAYAIAIEDDNNNGSSATSASMNATGSVRVPYEFKNKTIDNIVSEYDDNVIVYRINGGSFSLMGYEFTALNQTKYTFNELYMSAGSETVAEAHQFNTYTMSANDTDVPVIEVQGIIPAYSDTTTPVTKAGEYKAGEYIELPPIVAYNGYQNAEINLTVTEPDTSDGKSTPYQMYLDAAGEYTFEKEGNTATGKYAFAASKDGTYTITVNAYVGGVAATPATYTIKVGDVTGPEFSIVADSASNKAVVGNTFTFRQITDVSDDKDTAESKITISVKLYDPSNSPIEEVSKTSNWRNWKETDDITKTSYAFTKSGTYTVEYKVTDSRDNTTTQKYTITVSAKSSKTNVSLVALSTVLIVVAVLLIAGLIVYFVRFRKVKK